MRPIIRGTMSARLAYAALCLVWGGVFLFSSWGAELVSAGQLAVLRVALGLLPVAGFAIATGALRLRQLRHAHHFLVMSVLTTSVHLLLFAVGVSRLDSGIAGALAGTIPLFALVIAAVALREERIDAPRVAAIGLGLAGVVAIARPWAAAGGLDAAGAGAILAGSALLGASFVYARRFLTGLDLPAAALTTWQMGLGLLTLLLVVDLDGVGAIATDTRALIGVAVGLGMLGTGVASILYYVVVERLGAVTAASSTYVPPVIALVLGWTVNGEPARLTDAVGAALILAGVLGAARGTPAGDDEEHHRAPADAHEHDLPEGPDDLLGRLAERRPAAGEPGREARQRHDTPGGARRAVAP